jgi:uncharacterized Zn finger protein (UPF0148 family)
MDNQNTSAHSAPASIDLDKLQPCPFCGGPARIESSAMWLDLICDHDNTCCLDGDLAEISYQNAAGARDAMVAKWNRRDQQPAAPIQAASGAGDAWHEAVLAECMRIESCYVASDPIKTISNLINYHAEDITGINETNKKLADNYIKLTCSAPVHDAAAPSAEHALRPTDDELWDQTITDRDMCHEWADKLAEAIAKHFGADIGEHSNQNCPWHEALEVIESADSAGSSKSLAVAYDRFSAAVDRGMASAAAKTEQAPSDTCAEMRALCSSCGGTGDVHSLEGEWRGECNCPAGISLTLERLKIAAKKTQSENEELRAALASAAGAGSAQPAALDERALFEVWVRREFDSERMLERYNIYDPDDTRSYKSRHISDMWDGWQARAALAHSTASASGNDALERLLIEHRIAITPENEGGFHALIYRDQELPLAKGYGQTPREAVDAAMSPMKLGDVEMKASSTGNCPNGPTCYCPDDHSGPSTQQAAPEAPTGYKLVPLEPTPEQQQAGHDTPGAHMYNASYRAMVAAAPAPATQQAGAAVDLCGACDESWLTDPHDIEQGQIRCPKCNPAATTASASGEKRNIAAWLKGLAKHVRAVPEYKHLVGDMYVVDQAIVALESDTSAPSREAAPLTDAIEAMNRAKKLPVWDDIDHRLHIELDTIFAALARAPLPAQGGDEKGGAA